MTRAPDSAFDVVVLGGGVAGCVLAARLSENADRRVCLVEAGADHGARQEAWPAPLRNARALPREHVWERHAASFRIRARVLGGSSCINGCWNTWGSDADHAEWARAGGPRWSAAGLDRFRRRAVTQMQMTPVPEQELSQWSRAAVAGAEDLGWQEVDMALPGSPGYGMPLLNATEGLRRNVAFGYLDQAVRSRPNLTIIAGSTIDRLIVRAGRVRGAEVDVNGQDVTLTGGEYLLACGTFGSPAVLMRSGIGPAIHLSEVGVRVEVDLPGVGANLTDQPGVFVPLPPTPELNAGLAAKDAAGDLYVSRVLVRAASPRCPDGAWDLHLLPTAGPPLFGKLPPGQYEAGISAFLMKPVSRGRVKLRSADPADEPEITPALLSDEDGHDLRTLRHGLDLVTDLAATAPLNALAGPVIGRPGRDLTDDMLRTLAGTYWHPVGTCAMGGQDDGTAVVTPDARVRGVSNLRVVDASILPTVPAANTQLPVLAIAEMLADELRS
ncbi:GMC family oxidoreductase [Micromonospora sp. RB23]